MTTATVPISEVDEQDPIQKVRCLRHLCERSFIDFTRYFFKLREGNQFLENHHHTLITNTLMRVMNGEITRLIINIPPGYTKTEMAVINFIAYGLAKFPRSRFLHLSYSDNLALLNSNATKNLVELPEYQILWPMKLREDTKSKKMWYNKQGGGLYATATGGQVTGFRAGRMEDGFSGALIIDDPIKPEDAKSPLKRQQINDSFNNTIKSRLATEDVPIVVIMQRIHEDDLSGYLLRGGSGEVWDHLLLPVLTDCTAPYPNTFTHGSPLPHSLPDGPLWVKKHTSEQIEMIKQSHAYTYFSQYKQDPQPIGERIFHNEWWKFYDPKAIQIFESLAMYADTAQKTKEHNDFSVLQLWGKKEGCIYLIDQLRGKWEAPELERFTLGFIMKWFRPNVTFNKIRYMKVEDKVSGTGLIQSIKRKSPIPILPITRNTDKLTRAMDAAPFVEAGRVFLPEGAPFLIDYIDEFDKFTKDDSHNFDDQVDDTMNAIQDLLQGSIEIGTF